MGKEKKTINQNERLTKALGNINRKLIILGDGIGYLINLQLMEKSEVGSSEGKISAEHSKKVSSKQIKEPSNSYFG